MVNVFSFCLYGPYNARYYPGMAHNIQLALRYFPDWKVYVYIAPDVDLSFVQWMESCPNVLLRKTGLTGAINMIHRFYAIDEPSVDMMMVRDADSRIHWKDRWAIQEFERNSSFVAHTIRDNIEHTAYMMGGLWGIRKAAGLNIEALYREYKEDTSRGSRVGHDQNFLADVVYPRVRDRLLVHYSNNRLMPGEHGIAFPFAWTNTIYCGRIESNFVDSRAPTTALSFLSTTIIPIRR